MEDRKRFDASTHESLIIEFEIVVLQRTIECRMPAKTTLKKSLDSLKQCLHEEAGSWYDFNDAVIMDPLNREYLRHSMTLQECGCQNGSRLLVY